MHGDQLNGQTRLEFYSIFLNDSFPWFLCRFLQFFILLCRKIFLRCAGDFLVATCATFLASCWILSWPKKLPHLIVCPENEQFGVMEKKKIRERCKSLQAKDFLHFVALEKIWPRRKIILSKKLLSARYQHLIFFCSHAFFALKFLQEKDLRNGDLLGNFSDFCPPPLCTKLKVTVSYF